MKPLSGRWQLAVVTAFIALFSCRVPASFLQLVSPRDGSLPAVSGGGGSSQMPIVSADGRYVLFASTANNLALMTNGAPMIAPTLPALNVFLRDRASNTTTLVSANLAGTAGGNGDSLPFGISTNGQFVLFESSASNLVANDTNNAQDVFVRDVVNGTTTLVSVNTNGWSGSGESRDPAMTSDGRYIAFTSAAGDLVPGDTNGIPDIFVRDLQSNTTTLVSIGAMSTGSTVPTGSSEVPEITPDGRYVAFFSSATNLVPGTTTPGEIYVRDLVAGTTLWASASANAISQSVTGSTNEVSCNFSISADGQFVAFEVCTNSPSGGIILRYNLQSSLTDVIYSNAPVPTESFECIHDLDMTPDGRFVAYVATVGNNSLTNTTIYLWDAQTGSNTLVSPDLITGLPANGVCDSPVVSTNRRYVAFLSAGTDLVTNLLNGQYHVYLRDVQAATTSLLDVDANGGGFGVISVTVPSMSSDGSIIAFENGEDNVVANDGNLDSDVFVRALAASSTELVSAHDPGLSSVTPIGGASGVAAGSLSADGRYVAFFSDGDNITPNDTNGCRDVFVRDLMTGTNIPASLNTNGVPGDGLSTDPSISADGRYLAFTSSANDLVANDTNNAMDVFVRDLQSGTTALASVSTDGIHPGNADSFSPTISADGRYVLFYSKASNLAPGSFSAGWQNLFLRDLQAGTTYALTSGLSSQVIQASMTPDGRYVAFVGSIPGTFGGYVYVWNTVLAGITYTNILPTVSGTPQAISISASGQQLACLQGNPGIYGTIFGVNVTSNTTWIIQSNAVFLSPFAGLQFSSNGRFLTYAAAPLGSVSANVYLYDFLAGTNVLISQNPNTLQPANGASDSPDISPDGRFIAYRSAATDLAAGSTSGVPQLIVYDRLLGLNTLLSTASTSAASGDNRSLTPVFSSDSRTLVFASWASNLAPDDFNHFSDIFAFEFLYLNIALGAPGQGPTLTWPYVSGHSYQVQYKNNLTDNAWQPVAGAMNINGNQASLTDSAPASGQRFYQVVAQ